MLVRIYIDSLFPILDDMEFKVSISALHPYVNQVNCHFVLPFTLVISVGSTSHNPLELEDHASHGSWALHHAGALISNEFPPVSIQFRPHETTKALFTLARPEEAEPPFRQWSKRPTPYWSPSSLGILTGLMVVRQLSRHDRSGRRI